MDAGRAQVRLALTFPFALTPIRRINAWKKREVATLKLSLLTPAHFNEFKQEREDEDDAPDNTILLDLMVISALFKKAKKGWGMPYLAIPSQGLSSHQPSKWQDRRLNEAESARFQGGVECSLGISIVGESSA